MGKIDIKKRKKKENLLNSAYSLFTTIGFHKTTILSIALKAGVGKGTFYLYFKDKDEIMNELIIIKSSEILDKAVQAVKDSNYSLDFADKIVFITDYIINYLSNDLPKLKFISKYLSWGLFTDSGKYDKPDNDIIDMKQFIMNAIRNDQIKLKEPELLIFTIIELTNATCYSILLNEQPTTLEEYKPYLYNSIRMLVANSII